MDINTLGAIAILAVVVLTAFYLFQRVKAAAKQDHLKQKSMPRTNLSQGLSLVKIQK